MKGLAQAIGRAETGSSSAGPCSTWNARQSFQGVSAPASEPKKLAPSSLVKSASQIAPARRSTWNARPSVSSQFLSECPLPLDMTYPAN